VKDRLKRVASLSSLLLIDMLLTLDDILTEILREKASSISLARGHTTENKETIYKESWAALNAWIETKLSKRKGAEIPMLGSFTWEMKHQGDGRVMSRPLFMMSESFVKDHKVRRQRIHKSPDIQKPEEINYSKLAIKFSKSLTKDMIFAGTRDIIKKIGDFVDRSVEFEVEFTFGVFRSKERQVKFEFNQSRLAAILPENMRIGTLSGPGEEGGEESANQQIDTARYEEMFRQAQASSTASGQTNKPFAVPKLALKGTTSGAALPALVKEDASDATSAVSFGDTEPYQAAGTEGEGMDMANTAAFEQQAVQPPPDSPTTAGEGERELKDTLGRTIPKQDQTLSPRVVELMAAMDASLNAPMVDKVELRNRAKTRVEMQAYLRSLEGIEGDAKEEEKITRDAMTQRRDWEERTRKKVEAFHKGKKTINGWLQDQMATNKGKADRHKAEKLKFQPSFFLPDNAGNVLMPSGSVPGGPHKAEIKEGLKKDLKYQIAFNERKAALEKAKRLEEEKDYLDHVAMEIDLEAIQSRAEHLSKQSSMLESWERDAHIRNLHKLKTSGANAIKDYIYVNLPDASEAKETLKASGFASIGYDTRTGKL
jgi:hypothetical protein